MKASEIAALILASGAITYIGCYAASEMYAWLKHKAWRRRRSIEERWHPPDEDEVWCYFTSDRTGPCHNWKKEGF